MLQSLVGVSELWYVHSRPLNVNYIHAIVSKTHVPLAKLYPFLRPALMSHIHAHRLSALRVLLSSAVLRDAYEEASLRACFLAEEVALGNLRSPERVIKTGNVGKLHFVEKPHSNALDISVSWLLGT